MKNVFSTLLNICYKDLRQSRRQTVSLTKLNGKKEPKKIRGMERGNYSEQSRETGTNCHTRQHSKINKMEVKGLCNCSVCFE